MVLWKWKQFIIYMRSSLTYLFVSIIGAHGKHQHGHVLSQSWSRFYLFPLFTFFFTALNLTQILLPYPFKSHCQYYAEGYTKMMQFRTYSQTHSLISPAYQQPFITTMCLNSSLETETVKRIITAEFRSLFRIHHKFCLMLLLQVKEGRKAKIWTLTVWSLGFIV